MALKSKAAQFVTFQLKWQRPKQRPSTNKKQTNKHLAHTAGLPALHLLAYRKPGLLFPAEHQTALVTLRGTDH